MGLSEKQKNGLGLPKQSANLTFDEMVECLKSAICFFPDKRKGSNTRYSFEDVALGAFSLFFTQSPSFLTFQTAMQQSKGSNNARSLFGIEKIPSDGHIRDLMDEVQPSYVFPVFEYIIKYLKTKGFLDTFRSYNDNILCALYGVQYFSSKKIHCEKCNTKNHKNGTTTYYHTAITPVFVVPGNNQVISLPPESITPQDGHTKQDCENAAAKRWLKQYGPVYKGLGITVLGDDLYCKQPLTNLIVEQGLSFILVCKPDSHKTLYQWVEEIDARCRNSC